MLRVLDATDEFLDRMGSVEPVPLAVAVLCHLLKMACTSMAWRNVLAAAYPDERVAWRPIYGAYLAGVGVNAIVPARAGDAVRVVMAHRAIPGSTYTTIISSTLALSVFDITAASALLFWAITLGALPGLDVLATLERFDFAWLLSRPLAFELVVAGLLIGIVLLGFWIRDHVANFRARVAQAFRVFRPPTRYLVGVAPWQACDWALRLATIWFMLDAFDIPQSVQTVLLAQVAQSSATLLPITPSGVGTEQAFLLYTLHGVAPASLLLAYSIGARLALTVTNVVAGFTSIALTLRTIRVTKAVERSRAALQEEPAPETPRS